MTISKPMAAPLSAPADPSTFSAADCRETGMPPAVPCGPDEAIARVTAVDRDQYLIRNAAGEVPARLTGRTAYTSVSAVDLPCVGDWVRVRLHDDGAHASILEVLPRRSFLRRKRPGSAVEFQMIAANIDLAFIVQSCHFDFNVRRLERYLVLTREGGIEPVLLLTKTDLVSPATLAELVVQIRQAGIGAPVVALSNVSGEGIAAVRALLQPGQSCCLLGSSGVGKTTLVNRLLGDDGLATGAVSQSGEGRHTTTRRQLIPLPGGAFLIDMPGMRELGMLEVGEGLADSFADIEAHARHCRFADCRHGGEPGCAVRQAIEQGELDPEHFRNYLKLKKEAAFHDLSLHEKRNKDRAFGKLVRAAGKAKGRRHEY